MVYFNDEEVKVLKDMIEYYDSYSGEVPRECAELISQCKLRIVRVKQCRLTTLVTPLTHPQIDVTIDLQEQEDGAFRLNASIGKDGASYLTLKAEMKNE